MLNSIIAIGIPAGGEWIIILIIALLVFGGKKIPELMHGIGKGIHGFKEGMNGTPEEEKKDIKEDGKLKP